MRISKYFFYTSPDAPSNAEIASHKLMIKAGIISQSSSGIYYWLPLGLKVLNNIANIIRKEHEKFGAIEILMPTIQPASLWRESNRYDSYGAELLKFMDRKDQEMLYGPTNEETATDVFRKYVKSYKDLPKILYQIQWKFRDEIRPRFGVMRGREFLMKDLYSFDLTKEDAENTYNSVFKLYIKILKKLGVKPLVVQADSGAIGGNLSHEFHILADTGESTLYYDKKVLDIKNEDDFLKLKNLYAVSDEKYSKETCTIDEKDLAISKGIEVGHIFYFGQKYTIPMNCKVQAKDGSYIYPYMGSYGIGVSRLIGAICEAYHDQNGIIWPKEVAPFKVAIINSQSNNSELSTKSDEIYELLQSNNIETIYDDRDISAGKKFKDIDLIGIPLQIIIGNSYKNDKVIEIKNRATSEITKISSNEEILNFIKNHLNN